MEREREWRQRENALKVQIAQLEATLKADLGEKGETVNMELDIPLFVNKCINVLCGVFLLFWCSNIYSITFMVC